MEQDRHALNQLTNMVIAKHRLRRTRYIEADYYLRPFKAGDRAVWLWMPYEGEHVEPLPIRATILQVNKVQAHVRADFAIGPVVLWVSLNRLRHIGGLGPISWRDRSVR